jgi:hypothetical protein
MPTWPRFTATLDLPTEPMHSTAGTATQISEARSWLQLADNVALAQSIERTIRDFHMSTWIDEAHFIDTVIARPWMMPLDSALPQRYESIIGDETMISPEVGSVVVYKPDAAFGIDDGVNRLFYVLETKIVAMAATDQYYGGNFYYDVVPNLDERATWATLDDAEQIKPGIKAYAARFDPANYKPLVGDKMLVTRKPAEDEATDVYWVWEMGPSIGDVLVVTELGSEGDRVCLSNGYWYQLDWLQPVSIADRMSALRNKASKNLNEKIKTWNSPYAQRRYRRPHTDQTWGRETAKCRARAERREATEDELAAYLRRLHLVGETARSKIEPAYSEAIDKLGHGGWTRVGIVPDVVLNALHCLHVSSDDKTKIAYYPTLRHVREGREVRTSLGKYLTKYKDVYNLDENGCRDLAQKFMAMQTGEGIKLAFKEQDDPAGWVEVYEVGPQSCMKGSDAVGIYASGVSGLRLAYLEDVTGSIVARCIVRDSDNPDVNGWLRVYPEPDCDTYGRRLRDMLVEAGYTHRTNLDGCLLTYEEDCGQLVAPYIDTGRNGTQSVGVVYRDGKRYVEVGASGWEADDTDGTAGPLEDGVNCDCCGDNFNEDDTTYVDSAEERVCDTCLSEVYVQAYGRRDYTEWFARNDCTYCESDDNWYHDDYLENHDVYMCEVRGEYYLIEDLALTSRGWIHVDDVVELSECDEDGNDYAHPGDTVTLPDGRVVHEDMAETDWATGEPMLASDDDAIEVFARVVTSTSGGSTLGHHHTTLTSLVDCLDEWVVEFMPRFVGGKYVQPVSCITWKGQEAPGSAVMSFRDLTYDMIRSDEVFERIFEALEERGLTNSVEEAA